MKQKLMVAGLCAAGLLASGAALAGDTNTLTVTASVTPACKFNSATSTLDFGALDPSLASNPTASSTTTYWCTKGSVASTTPGDGLNHSGTSRQLKGPNASDLIPYSLSLTGGTQTGAGKSTPLTLTMNGGINNADYINATAGAYSDTVTLTITP